MQIIEIDTMPITLDLPPIVKGSDYSWTIEMLDDNDAVKATTGWTMQIKGRDNGVNGAEIFNLTVGAGITHTPSLGRFVVKIAHATTSTINVTKIYWDCKVTDNNGDVSFPFEGIFEIRQAVTR